MGSKTVSTDKQLSALWKDKNIEVLDTSRKKYVLMSDLHLGNGGGADDLRDNEKVLIKALEHYKKNGFSLILLGDIEELWQFDIDEVTNRYTKTVYNAIRKFGDKKVYRIFGNHDYAWRGEIDPLLNETTPFGSAKEAVKMNDIKGRTKILLLHGHQGTADSDKWKWFSKYWVRCYRYIEPAMKWLHLAGNGSAAMSQIPDDYERTFYTWAKKNKAIIICGHSHRAIFASHSYIDRLEEEIKELQKKIKESSDDKEIEKLIADIDKLAWELAYEVKRKRKIDPAETSGKPKPCYFNTGCGLYNDGITAIEIQHDDIRLVKWNKKKERIIYQPGKITHFINEIT